MTCTFRSLRAPGAFSRGAALALALGGAALTSGCVVAPSTSSPARTADVARMGELAVTTCGAGQVREVNAKSFTCK